jgi:hypothetical protein
LNSRSGVTRAQVVPPAAKYGIQIRDQLLHVFPALRFTGELAYPVSEFLPRFGLGHGRTIWSFYYDHNESQGFDSLQLFDGRGILQAWNDCADLWFIFVFRATSAG